MWPNPQFSANLVTFAEEILNGKLHFLCGVWWDSSQKQFTSKSLSQFSQKAPS